MVPTLGFDFHHNSTQISPPPSFKLKKLENIYHFCTSYCTVAATSFNFSNYLLDPCRHCLYEFRSIKDSYDKSDSLNSNMNQSMNSP